MHDITASPPTVPTADICDSRDDVQVVAKVFRDFGGNADACGKAVVLCTNNDNSEIKSRLRSPGNGRILVIDNNGSG